MSTNPRSSFQSLTDRLPIFHPQPKTRSSPSTPRASRDWSNSYDLPSRRTSLGLPTPGDGGGGSGGGGGSRGDVSGGGAGSGLKYGLTYGLRQIQKRGRHRRQLSLSSFSGKGVSCLVLLLLSGAVVFVLGLGFAGGSGSRTSIFGEHRFGLGSSQPGGNFNGGGVIPLGQSRTRDGREVFWWEQFMRLDGYYGGWREVVPYEQWIAEQDGGMQVKASALADRQNATEKPPAKPPARVEVMADRGFTPCYMDEKNKIMPPKLTAFSGLPQGFPKPLLGSYEELDLRHDVCYDRINRFGPYGFGFAQEDGGLGIPMEGDVDLPASIRAIDYREVYWAQAQDICVANKRYSGARTAFIIRTWHDFEYTPYHVMMLRAIISELSLLSGGKYTVHFLIHVRDDSIPIWASDEVYNQVLENSLPYEFAGMGTLWSVAFMKLIYPPPFPESMENFSGGDVYQAYRSLHFPLQYFASKHIEFDYFWQWEMDIRLTGSYLELLEQVTKWAEKQERDLQWEYSAQFFISALFNGSYAEYMDRIRQDVESGRSSPPIIGPQLPESQRLTFSDVRDPLRVDHEVDLITFSPLFDPEHTRWAFHNDITGYPPGSRPPTRAALITASRLSRRLLVTMHHETFRNKHTMFPEMFPASVALQYGYKAVAAPLPIYFDRDWPSTHADEIFNNAVVGPEGRKAGMDHGAGHFHGEGGSVFGPGEHVFRGASWYANAGFGGYLWRRWLGQENGTGELEWESEPTRGRMCLPMMMVHPVKFE